MRTETGRRRITALVAASALASGAVVGLATAPAAAAATAPTDLQNAGHPCDTNAPGPYLRAMPLALRGTIQRGPESAELRADFQLWDIADPAHPQQLPADLDDDEHAYVQIEDESRLIEGSTYAWRVRILGATDPSPWSSTCHFTIDRSGGPAPTADSAEYPPSGENWTRGGAIGVPGVFRLTAPADDTVDYFYRFSSSELANDDPYTAIGAEGLGGPATIHWTPQAAGLHWLSVYGVDRAGNRSEYASYAFEVKETRPNIRSVAYPDYYPNLDYNIGVPGAFTFDSTVADTASFTWWIDEGGPSGTAPADADGNATVMIAPTRGGRQRLHVRAVTHDGTAHASRAYQFVVDNGPTATRDSKEAVPVGSTAKIHLSPRMPEVEAYLYWPQDGWDEVPLADKQVVAARADGTADIFWRVTRDNTTLRVQSRSADGTLSEARQVPVSVDDAMPTVTRTGGTDLGTPATVTVRTRMVDVAEYVTKLSHQPERVITPAADGSATFEVTASKVGTNQLRVFARNADGIETAESVTTWSVTDAPLVTSAEFPKGVSGRLVPGSFHFAPRLPGTVAYEYSFNSGPTLTIPAAPDGTATVAYTPATAGDQHVAVRSVTADGASSLSTGYRFTIDADLGTISSVTPATAPAGGVRKVTIRGAGLHPRDTIQVTPAKGEPVTVKVTVASGTKTLIGEVDLSSAATGPATLTLRSYAGGTPMVLSGAFTITPPPPLVGYDPPMINGLTNVGNTVKATPGTWSPTPKTYQYQWLANGSAIKGATGTSFKIPASLVGKRLTFTVTVSQTGYTSTKATAQAMIVAKGKAPKATKRPKIVGTPKAGKTLKVNVGAWSPKADSYRYEWRVNGKLIKGAKTSKLKLKSSMRNKRITVTVIAKKTGYADGRATSKAVKVRK